MLRHIVLSIFKHATDHLKLVSQRLQPLLAKRLAVLEIARLDCVYVTPNPKPAKLPTQPLGSTKALIYDLRLGIKAQSSALSHSHDMDYGLAAE